MLLSPRLGVRFFSFFGSLCCTARDRSDRLPLSVAILLDDDLLPLLLLFFFFRFSSLIETEEGTPSGTSPGSFMEFQRSSSSHSADCCSSCCCTCDSPSFLAATNALLRDRFRSMAPSVPRVGGFDRGWAPGEVLVRVLVEASATRTMLVLGRSFYLCAIWWLITV